MHIPWTEFKNEIFNIDKDTPIFYKKDSIFHSYYIWSSIGRLVIGTTILPTDTTNYHDFENNYKSLCGGNFKYISEKKPWDIIQDFKEVKFEINADRYTTIYDIDLHGRQFIKNIHCKFDSPQIIRLTCEDKIIFDEINIKQYLNFDNIIATPDFRMKSTRTGYNITFFPSTESKNVQILAKHNREVEPTPQPVIIGLGIVVFYK